MSKSTVIWGSILIFVGLFFLLRTMNLIWFSFGDLMSTFFPLMIIALGIWLIVRKRNQERYYRAAIHVQSSGTADEAASATSKAQTDSDPSKLAEQQARAAIPSPPPASQPVVEDKAGVSASTDTTGKIRYSKMLGDMFVNCEGLSIHNVEISGGVGDLDIQVTGGVLSKGLNRMVISGFIGDIRVFLPKDIAYFSHCSNFAGDIELPGKRSSGFGNTVEHHTADYEKAESKLYLAVNSSIGDIKIYQI